MRKIIYIGLVGFLFVIGFLNLDGNDGKPVELPEFTTNFFESGEKILPNEKWEETLIGEWNYISDFDEHLFKGRVTYNRDKTFVRKVSYTFRRKDKGFKAGGTVRGTWKINEDMTWTEYIKECNIIPKEPFSVCSSFFKDSGIYGKKDSDTWDYELIYFNDSRILIRAKSLAGGETKMFKFTRVEN